MVTKEVYVRDILYYLGKDVIETRGDIGTRVIDNITNVERVNGRSLDWIKPSNPQKQSMAENSLAKVLLVDSDVVFSQKMQEQDKFLIVVEKPKLALMSVLHQFFSTKPETGIDSSAYIHPEAIIGKDVHIGPHCYIGKCVIGDGNVIHGNVHIYDRTVIGNNNVIHAGAVICVDGLGCVRHADGKLEEFPQIGGVVIGDNCYIGANTHIASGSLSDTIIGNGCKINGMTFIGSNDILGENVWITGSVMLCGSVTVGRNTNIFSKSVIRDWVSIGERVTIGMGAVVTKNIPDGETWFGAPAHKIEKK